MPITDEEAAIQAVNELRKPTTRQQDAQAKIKAMLALDEPFTDIHELFGLYNILYFRSLLVPRVEVSWSTRLTLCAGMCELIRDPSDSNSFSKVQVKLSEPLLKFRPRSDVVNTLLHESIHAYLFVTNSWRHSYSGDGTGHGQGFLLLADAINNHGGYQVTVLHSFHDEVESFRTHVWRCDGPCQSRPPFFGLVKRSMNRAPGKTDLWWQRHLTECGGTFTKIAEPEPSKEQLHRMSGLKRAGMQKNKINGWLNNGQVTPPKAASEFETVSIEVRDMSKTHEGQRTPLPANGEMLPGQAPCPICGNVFADVDMFDHVNLIHPP